MIFGHQVEKMNKWVYIKGYKWPYRINEEGTVQKYYLEEWVTLEPYLTDNRARVSMRTKENKRVSVPVVWLMADAFMGGRKPGYSIVHKNHYRLDNSLGNLLIVSKKDAAYLSCGNRRRSVEKIDMDGNVIALYKSMKEAADANYISKNSVSERCRNKLKDPYRLTGFTFRYEKVE